jgi:hypothetical protein
MRRFAKRTTKGAETFVEQETATLEQRPMLDEATFQQLLAAAYVLQQQQQEEKSFLRVVPPLPATRVAPDATDALAIVAQTQNQLLSQLTNLPAAARLVADCLSRITHASGVGIALVREGQLEYCAAVGSLAPFVGSRTPMTSELSASAPSLFDELTQGETAALVAAAMETNTFTLPLHREGAVAGLLEAQFEDGTVIQEHDIRSCQLMAGLMTQTIARAAELEWKGALAAERATMIEVLERIRPQLERLAGNPQLAVPQPQTPPPAPQVPEPPVVKQAQPEIALVPPLPVTEAVAAAPDATCRHCGYKFGIGELFCGRCGTARPSESSTNGDLQSKWSSLWHPQQNAGQRDPLAFEELTSEGRFDFAAADEPPTALEIGEQNIRIIDMPDFPADAEQPAALAATPSNNATVSHPKAAIPWSSSVHTRKWLESLQPNAPARVWIERNRANLYLGVAVLILVVVLLGLGPRTPASSAGANQSNLSLFEQVLVSLHLAVPPPAPVYAGNPNTQVWVDLHTALYYCSGSDLYGKTPNGKFTTQRDAQMDHFEPAANRSCN